MGRGRTRQLFDIDLSRAIFCLLQYILVWTLKAFVRHDKHGDEKFFGVKFELALDLGISLTLKLICSNMLVDIDPHAIPERLIKYRNDNQNEAPKPNDFKPPNKTRQEF